MSIWKKFVDLFFVKMPTEVVPEPKEEPTLIQQLDKIIEEEKVKRAASDQITNSVTQAKPKRKPRAKKAKNENT